MTIYSLGVVFPNLEPVYCSMSSSTCCFLTCIQISQEAGQVVWYFHLFQDFSQFVVIYTVKDFGIFNKAEIDVFLELSCFFHDPADVGNLISSSSTFSKTSLELPHIRGRGGGRVELPHVRGQGQLTRGATPHPRSGSFTGAGGLRRATPRSRSGKVTSSKVRSSGCILLEQP